jgi:fermentation-respiration switch protein FrsA (DUF1100 family)
MEMAMVGVGPPLFCRDPSRGSGDIVPTHVPSVLNIGLFGAGDESSEYKTFVVPLSHGDSFPDLPFAGIKSESDVAHLRGVHVIPEFAYPGPDGSRYALSRSVVHRNIYRIPIP